MREVAVSDGGRRISSVVLAAVEEFTNCATVVLRHPKILKMVNFVYIIALFVGAACGRIINIEDHGAIAGSDKSHSAANGLSISAALQSATSGDTVLVPAGKEFWTLGGINATGLNNVAIEIAGTLHATPDMKAWPKDPPTSDNALNFISLIKCNNVSLSGGGVVDGQGLEWWNRVILGLKPDYNRPHLVVVCPAPFFIAFLMGV